MEDKEYHVGYLDRNGKGLKIIQDRIYYYQGNFFHPINLVGNQQGLVLRAIRNFIKTNKTMVDRDRKNSNYRTLEQLAFEE